MKTQSKFTASVSRSRTTQITRRPARGSRRPRNRIPSLLPSAAALALLAWRVLGG